MIEAILFDWDGVVSDSDGLSEEAEQISAVNLAAQIGMESDIASTDWAQFRGWPRVKIAATLFNIDKNHELTETYRQKVVDTSVEIMGPHNLRPIEGVEPFLNYTQRHIGVLGVATSSNRRILDPSIQLFGLTNYFRETLAHRECREDKPQPDQYLELMRRFNVDPKRTLVIEDSPSGITAGRYSGALVLAIATTNTEGYLRRSTDAHLVAKDYKHAVHLLAPYMG